MQNVVRCAVHCVFCESDTVLLQNLDASTLETYIQQLQDHFSKGTKYDSASEDQQVWADTRSCTVVACSCCGIKCIFNA